MEKKQISREAPKPRITPTANNSFAVTRTTPGAPRSISIVRSDFQRGLFSQGHLGHSFVPTFNNLSNANNKLEGTSLAETTVELLAVGSQRANVRHCELITFLRKRRAITGFDCLFCNTHNVDSSAGY